MGLLAPQLDAAIQLTNFDLAFGLLHALHAVSRSHPALLPSKIKPYAQILRVTAEHTKSLEGMQVLALLQENDALPPNPITPYVFHLVIRSLYGDQLLDPKRIALPRDGLTQPVAPADDPWKASIFTVLIRLFGVTSHRWTAQPQSYKIGKVNYLPVIWTEMLDACFLAHDINSAKDLFAKMSTVPIHNKAKSCPSALTSDAVRVMLAGLYHAQGPKGMLIGYAEVLEHKSSSQDDIAATLQFELEAAVGELAKLATQAQTNEVAKADWHAVQKTIATTTILSQLAPYFSSSYASTRDGAHQGVVMWLRLTQPEAMSMLSRKQVELLHLAIPAITTQLESLCASYASIAGSDPLASQVAERLVDLVERSLQDTHLADAAAFTTHAWRWILSTIGPPSAESAVPSALLDRLIPLDEPDAKPSSERERLLTKVANLVLDIVKKSNEKFGPTNFPVSEQVSDEEQSASASSKAGLRAHFAEQQLTMLVQTFDPLVTSSTFDADRREVWDQNIVALYRTAAWLPEPVSSNAEHTSNESMDTLDALSHRHWSHLVDAFAYEESTQEPDWNRVQLDGLARLIQDANQFLQKQVECQIQDGDEARRDARNMLRPWSTAAADVLLGRYGGPARSLLEQMSPRLAHILQARPWTVTESVTASSGSGETKTDARADPESLLLGSQGATRFALSFSLQGEEYPALQEIDEDLGWSIAQSLAKETPVSDTTFT